MKTVIKKKIKKNVLGKKVFTKFYPQIFSRHSTHFPLRKGLPLFPYRVTVRFGSTTESIAKVQINSVQSIRNSSNKTLMKECFDRAGIKTAPWCKATEFKDQFKYPIVVKHNYGSRGNGLYKFIDAKSFDTWKRNRNLSEYIVEAYNNMAREYRLHVTEKHGCFYSCRKVLKEETPEDKRWIKNDETCNWILPENPLYDKPSTFKEIEKDCIAALKAVGLSFGAFDVRVQGKDKKNPDWSLCEVNSAPSFGSITLEKYKKILPELIKEAYETKN